MTLPLQEIHRLLAPRGPASITTPAAPEQGIAEDDFRSILQDKELYSPQFHQEGELSKLVLDSAGESCSAAEPNLMCWAWPGLPSEAQLLESASQLGESLHDGHVHGKSTVSSC